MPAKKDIPTVDVNPMEVSDEEYERMAAESDAEAKEAVAEFEEEAAKEDQARLASLSAATLGPNEGLAVCRMSGYEGITAVYDLSQSYARVLTRPTLRDRREGESLKSYRDKAIKPFVDDLAEWLDLFLVRVTPWNLTTRRGEALPSFEESPSAAFRALLEGDGSHWGFGQWLAYVGFDEAARNTIKN